MREIFLDFETYYDDEYSLRKMTPVEYILDERFEVIGCAVKDGKDGDEFWLDAHELPGFFAGLDPGETMMITHNALFDMCIVAWIYHFIPKLMVDTLGVSRAVLGHKLRSVSLEKVSEELGLPAKGTAIHKVKGMHAADIQADGALWLEFMAYGLGDVRNCAGIFDKLVRTRIFPTSELIWMDTVLRCAIEPKFKLDVPVLEQHKEEILAEKETLLANAMLLGADGKTDLMSNDRFATLLQRLGVDPPRKVSMITGLENWAFAKTDEDFIALSEHPDPSVQAIMAARLGHKSTLAESRCERMLKISQLTWPSNLGLDGAMPVPLKFSAAHTHRLGGDWKLNMQNLPTRHGSKALRQSLVPLYPGDDIYSVDAAQIEARITAWVCGQWDLVQQFEDGVDVYSDFASTIFGYKVERKRKDGEHAAHGFIGKTGILQLGFGCGHVKFDDTVALLSGQQTGTVIQLGWDESSRIVMGYRRKYSAISGAWNTLGQLIQVLAQGGTAEFGPCLFSKETITGPNGLSLHYHGLKFSDGEWRFTYGGKPKRIYGGKVLENIVQFLARIVIVEAAERIRAAGLNLGLQVHDELVYAAPRSESVAVKSLLLREMSRRPTWAPQLPLAAAVESGPSYGDAH